MMQRRTKLILLPLALALTLGLLALGYTWWQLHKPLALPAVLEVPRGTSLNGLLREFEREQIISSLLGNQDCPTHLRATKHYPKRRLRIAGAEEFGATATYPQPR